MNLSLELFKEDIAEIILLNYFGINIFDDDKDLGELGERFILNFKHIRDLFLSFPCFDGWPWRELWY